MRSGRLRHRVTIEEATDTRDGVGHPIPAWMTWAIVWAEIVPLSGRELYAAQEVHNEITTRIWLRYREGLTTKMRLRHGSTIYNINAPINSGERNKVIQLLCSQGLNDG